MTYDFIEQDGRVASLTIFLLLIPEHSNCEHVCRALVVIYQVTCVLLQFHDKQTSISPIYL